MGPESPGQSGADLRVGEWLRAGGEVVASSDRAARAVSAAYHSLRRSEGLAAWPAPHVQSWTAFVRTAWEARAADSRLLLNPTQEQSLWANVIEESGHTAGWLTQPRYRLAASAMDAHELLCAYAPHLLRTSARAAWPGDSAAFSLWLTRFEDVCRAQDLASPTRLPLELLPLLESAPESRPPLLLAGFDRLLPIQRKVLDAWGDWRELQNAPFVAENAFYAAPDEQTEVAACARWCNHLLAKNPDTRLLVIAQDAAQRRGEIERAFLQHVGAAYEFSLGVPLSRIALVRAASLLLRWLDADLSEQDLDWLLASGYATSALEQSASLQSHMRSFRRRSLERTSWSLLAFRRTGTSRLPPGWINNITQAEQRLASSVRLLQTPLFWADLIPQLLRDIGWPGTRPLTSAEFQARDRWQQALDLCASLGFDGRRLSWHEFLAELDRILDETLFAPESENAPIVIAGPAESAGLTADAIWFLGAGEDTWPARGSLHPLLPPGVQRETRMPHASTQLDWDLAESISNRLLASAPRVRFSYARLQQGVESRPSRLVTSLAGSPTPLSPELMPGPIPEPLTETFLDIGRIPYASPRDERAPVEIRGGSTVLTAQSQCPFKAFATARLGAESWQPAQAGLTAAQRGQLLHAVLHSVWGDSPRAIRTLEQLQQIPVLEQFVQDHVDTILADEIPNHVREGMPVRYLELEGRRLTRVVSEWLTFERTRLPFTVTATERDTVVNLAGLTLKLRLDRVDTLNDCSVLVVDYKTGNVSQRSWDLPRPDDVQLPLYAAFGLSEHTLGGLVFAKVRPGNHCFEGKVGDAAATLLPGLKGNTGLITNPLTAEQLLAWQEAIEQLARDFLAGRADVDPRDYPKTCERCGLHSLCRVQERTDEVLPEDDSQFAEINDE